MTLLFLLACVPDYTYSLGQIFLDCSTPNMEVLCFSGMTEGGPWAPHTHTSKVNGGVTLIIPHLENDFVIFIFIIPLKKD
jgi:hypothetical protein